MLDREFLKKKLRIHEGVRRFPYQDSVGILTIGVGRNLQKGLRDNEIELMLDNDIEEAVRESMRLSFYASLDDARKYVIVNMMFNLGPQRFATFVRTQTAIAEGKYQEAADYMRHSKWYVQVGKRGEELCQVMETGKLK